MKDIGPETARTFVEYMSEHQEMVGRLFSELQIQVPEKNPEALSGGSLSNELMGKSFCVTGSFEGISRGAIHELIEQHGGEVRTSVSAKLDYLIVGGDAGSKKSKAEDLGVKCIGFEELQTMI